MTDTLQKVHQVIDDQWDEQLLFLKSLISYKSTLGNEKGVQNFIQSHLKDMKMETTSFDVDPKRLSKYKNFGEANWSYQDRPVVVGEWKNNGGKKGKSLILQGHVDVVSAEPEHLWDFDPYQAEIVDNKMYGRASVDMKGGVAAMIYAVKALKKAGIELGADLQIQTVIEEECTGNGALAPLDKGFTADAALITEPTALRAMRSQLGVMWAQVKVSGKGAHVEQADRNINAINKAAYLVQSLDDYREFINSRPKHDNFKNHPHPLNVNVGVIKGGDWASNVPSECTFEVRAGFYPDQDPDDMQAEIKDWIMNAAAKDSWLKECPPEVTFYGFHAPGCVNPTDSDLFKTLEKAHQTVTDDALDFIDFTATTDVRAFEEFGIPATCYGPSGSNMHGPNEYIELDSLKTVTKSIAAFILDWCKEK